MKDIKAACREKIQIVAHRGVSGGNIPCNSIAAYDIALKHGADMLEIDVDRTKDGQLVIFHPKQERIHLCWTGSIHNYTLDELRQVMFLCNCDTNQTEWRIPTLAEVFERYKGKCYINVDKFWGYPSEIAELIKKYNIQEQIVVKSVPSDEVVSTLEKIAPEIMFLPVYKQETFGWHELLKKRKVNYVGAELVFATETCEVGTREFREMLRNEGYLLWANAILYNYRVPLAAGHTDDVSLVDDPAKGWGWLADQGFDFIQTDWVMAMGRYLASSGKLYRSR